MIILIDTCILRNDRLLRGKHYKILRSASLASGAKIMVPGVVIEELLRQYEDELAKATRALLDKKTQMEKLGVAVGIDVDKLTLETRVSIDGFRQMLIARLATIGGVVLEHPNVPHSRIAMKAVRKRKPFASGGKGYPDALIWFSALQVLIEQPHESLVLLTDNISDFAAKEGTSLHEDLVADLKEYDIQCERISLVRDTNELYLNFVEPAQDQLAIVRERFNEDKERLEYVAGIIEEVLENDSGRLGPPGAIHRDAEEILSLDAVAVHSLDVDSAWSEGSNIILSGDAEASGRLALRVVGGYPLGESIEVEDVDCSIRASFLVAVDFEACTVLDVEVTDCDLVDMDTSWFG